MRLLKTPNHNYCLTQENWMMRSVHYYTTPMASYFHECGKHCKFPVCSWTTKKGQIKGSSSTCLDCHGVPNRLNMNVSALHSITENQSTHTLLNLANGYGAPASILSTLCQWHNCNPSTLAGFSNGFHTQGRTCRIPICNINRTAPHTKFRSAAEYKNYKYMTFMWYIICTYMQAITYMKGHMQEALKTARNRGMTFVPIKTERYKNQQSMKVVRLLSTFASFVQSLEKFVRSPGKTTSIGCKFPTTCNISHARTFYFNCKTSSTKPNIIPSHWNPSVAPLLFRLLHSMFVVKLLLTRERRKASKRRQTVRFPLKFWSNILSKKSHLWGVI